MEESGKEKNLVPGLYEKRGRTTKARCRHLPHGGKPFITAWKIHLVWKGGTGGDVLSFTRKNQPAMPRIGPAF